MKRILALLLTVCMAVSLCGCSSSDYKKAVSLLDAGEYADAITLLEELGDYEDSAELLKSACSTYGQQLVDSADTLDEHKMAIELLEKAEESKDTSVALKTLKFKYVYNYILENGEECEVAMDEIRYKGLNVDSTLENSKVYILCDEDNYELNIYYYQSLAGLVNLMNIIVSPDSSLAEFFLYENIILYYAAGFGTIDLSNVRSINSFVFDEYELETDWLDFSPEERRDPSHSEYILQKYSDIFMGADEILAEQLPIDVTLHELCGLNY